MKYEMIDAKAILGTVLMEAARENGDIVLISTDSANRSGFTEFIKEYPKRYFELGIMEQSALSVSSGFATMGKIPVFCAPAPFVTARPFEMFKVDLGYMRQNAKMIGRNCGFNYSDLGPTHYGLEDIALVRLIPDVMALAPMDATDLRAAFKAALSYKGPVYMRLSTAPIPKLFDDGGFELGKGRLIMDGSDVTLVCTGEITANALEAAEILKAKGVSVRLVGLSTVIPLDEALILESARKTGRVVTVEEHFAVGGLGSMVCELLSENHPVPVKKIGVPHTYISSGPYKDMIKNFGLSPEGIAEATLGFLK